MIVKELKEILNSYDDNSTVLISPPLDGIDSDGNEVKTNTGLCVFDETKGEGGELVFLGEVTEIVIGSDFIPDEFEDDYDEEDYEEDDEDYYQPN